MKKVLIVLHELVYSSGTPRTIAYLVKALKERGDEVLVLAPQQGQLQQELISYGAKIFINPQCLSDPTPAYNLAKQVDVVISPSVVTYQALYAANAANKPSIQASGEGMFGIKMLATNNIMQQAMGLATHVSVSSPDNAIYFSPYTKKAIRVIPHSVPVEESPNYKKPFEKEKDKTYIVQVGSVEARKGYDVAINAIEALKNPNVVFHIVGRVLDQTLYQQLTNYITQNKLNVKFVGEVDYNTAKAYIQHSDIYLMTTRDEATPMAVLEAQALGVPVIVTNKAVVESVEHEVTGLAYELEDYTSVAGGIKRLLEDTELYSKLRRNAIKYIKEERSLDKFISKYKELIDA